VIATRSQGSGPAVLWIHGYTMDSTTWLPLWELLPGWRHVGVDLPGHGRSGPVPAGMTLPQLAAAIADIARAEAARSMVALSFGSLAAVQLAVDHPDVLTRLVLAAPTLAGSRPEPLAKRRYQELVMLKRLAGTGEALVDLWMRSPPDIFRGTERHPRLRAQLRSVIARHAWQELEDGAMQTLTAGRHTPAGLRRIKARTLVVTGSEDMPAFAENARLLCDLVGDCRQLTVDRAGHLPLLERPETVAPAIADHLSRDLQACPPAGDTAKEEAAR
jgi:pimeloyl-ACP methyl ester carboxylesterase